MANISEIILVAFFGTITFVATVVGINLRDSLCCLLCRSLGRVWSMGQYLSSVTRKNSCTDLWEDPNIGHDIEAVAGLQHAGHQHSPAEDGFIFELQPQRSLPLYFDGAISETDSQEDQGSNATITPITHNN
ncbi:hypothetical protein J1614_004141 [Plenodomus biglobosus]|nr:hypothetical protein J1614_004141 [Plenodomus biglobosus]